MPATELSGFALDDDMSDTLVIAISQSGTTTDTNRTVDLVRARGASGARHRQPPQQRPRREGRRRALHVRRPRRRDERRVHQGVLRADRRRLPAGARHRRGSCPAATPTDRDDLLAALRDLPDAMEQVLAAATQIAEAAHRFAPSRRYWAVVGNGANRIAAEEIRIKLSELCYKSIACDATEDKKHIDLSSEPLILVCAAGLDGPNADDVAKEVAIYRAHKAAPIVIATEGEARSRPRCRRCRVPRDPPAPRLRAVDDGRPPVRLRGRARHRRAGPAAARGARARSRRRSPSGRDGDRRCSSSSARRLEPLAARFFDGLRAGCLRRPPRGEHGGAAGVAAALRAPASRRSSPTRSSSARSARPSVVIEDLTAALTRGIEELTRPVDAIKHQAKTVTVGISRSDEALLRGAAGARRCSRPACPRPAELPRRCARWPRSTRRSPR